MLSFVVWSVEFVAVSDVRHILVMLDVGKYCILHHQIKKIYVLMLLYRTLQRRTIKHFRYNLNHMKTNVRFGIIQLRYYSLCCTVTLH